jgi:hypothetical protein
MMAEGMSMPSESFAGAAPVNGAELAEAHKPYDATLLRFRRATSPRSN